MEEGPASRGEPSSRSSSASSSGRESSKDPATREESPSHVAASDSGSMSRLDEMACGNEAGNSNTVDGDMETRDGGVAGGEEDGVRSLQRKRSAHVMGEPPEEEEGLSTGTAGSDKAEAPSDSTPPDPELEEEVLSLYNLFAISVSWCRPSETRQRGNTIQ